MHALRAYVLNRCISVKTGQINTKLEILWILMCSLWLWGSIVVNSIIYRLIPSPSRFEIRQYKDFSLSSFCPWEWHVSSKGLLRYKREIRSISTIHFLEIIKQKYILQALNIEQCVPFSFQIKAHNQWLWKNAQLHPIFCHWL